MRISYWSSDVCSSDLLDIDRLADLLVARAREDHAEDLLAGHAMKRGGDAGGVLDHDTPLPRQTGKTRGKCIGLRPASSTDEAQRRGVHARRRHVRLRDRRSARRQVRDAFQDKGAVHQCPHVRGERSEEHTSEHTSELQSLMRISYAVFCLKKKKI